MNFGKHIAAIMVIACLQGCTAVKTALHNVADLDDYAIFANRVVAPSGQPLSLPSRPSPVVAGLAFRDEQGT